MTEYTIKIYENDDAYNQYKCTAVFDGYDCAPDADYQPLGTGDSHREAINNLIAGCTFDDEV